MNNLNSILIEGNLVKDPESRTTAKGTALCTFTIATNRYYRKDGKMEKEVSYVDVEAWGKLAEYCQKNGTKGKGVRVVGRLKQDRWTGKDGKLYSRISIIAEHIEFRPEFKKESASGQDTPDTGTSFDEEDEAAEIGFAANF